MGIICFGLERQLSADHRISPQNIRGIFCAPVVEKLVSIAAHNDLENAFIKGNIRHDCSRVILCLLGPHMSSTHIEKEENTRLTRLVDCNTAS